MTSIHDSGRRPFWQIMAIFDPDRTGGDFSYTVGLHERGVPELHLHARPSLGEDPGEDWKFSQRDTMLILNELAWQWLDGRLTIGDTFEEAYDDGLTTVRYQVDPVGDRELLEALLTDPDAQVVPIRWSLHRAPVGKPGPMTAEGQACAEAQLAEALDRLDPSVPAPPGWEMPEPPDWSPQGRFGPRTPLVLARAAELWHLDADGMEDLVDAGLCAQTNGPLTWPLAVARSSARPVGRLAALDAVGPAVGELITALGPRATDWAVEPGLPDEEERLRGRASDFVGEIVAVALAVEVVGDVIPADSRLAGLGPLLMARVPRGTPPGQPWIASEEVVATVDELVVGLGAVGVLAVAGEHEAANDDEAYLAVVRRTTGFAATSAAGWFPRTPEWPRLLGQLVLERARRGHEGSVAIQAWGTCVAALLTHRMLFTAEEVDAFSRVHRDSCPELAGLLNSPPGRA